MSLYGRKIKIDGVVCGLILRDHTQNGRYSAVFEREYASLEQIEAINWAAPTVTGSDVLPEGYGFTMEKVTYDSGCWSFTVMLQTAKQYLGDVTGYQAQLEELQEAKAALEEKNAVLAADKTSLEQQLAEADEAAIALYDMYAALSAAVTPTREEDAE